MHIDKTGGANQNKDSIDLLQQTNQSQQTSVFGSGYPDKNGDGYIDAFDFDNDENIIKKLEEAGLMGQLWKDAEDRVNSLLNRTNMWIVQNNQTISQIAIMILKQTKPEYTKEDIANLSNQLIQMNSSKLDGSKKGFLVNAQIKLPFYIDISKEKQSENPVFDYVWGTQSKRIQDIVSKYNLIDKNGIKSQMYQDALLLSNEFIRQYGYLDSTTREHLILSPHFEATEKTNQNIKAVREDTWYGETTIRFARVDKNVKKYKTGNCGECSELLIKMCFEKFQNKYDFSELNFGVYRSEYTIDHDREHVAMLMKSEDGDEEYIIDPWISPKNGAIFTRKDWETMVKEVYMVKDTEEVDFYESYSDARDLKREKLFYDNVKILIQEIPQENLDGVSSFTSYVSHELRKGNTFSEKVIDLYKQYASSEYREIFETQKDFYAKRELIKKEVSEDASMYVDNFGREVFDNLIKNKEYPKEIMDLFKRFCKSRYCDYLKTLEVRKHYAEIEKAFPDKDIKELTEYYWEFASAVDNGLWEGKTYSDEIMDLYFKCDYIINNKSSMSNAESRIKKTEEDYSSFEKSFYSNMTPQTLNNFLNSITDNQAALVTLGKYHRKLITDIDKAKSGWGNGKDKKALIMPLVDFITKACWYLPKEDIEEFRQRCLKELDAKFYTDEKEIRIAFGNILREANKYYKKYGYFDHSLWLEKKLAAEEKH